MFLPLFDALACGFVRAFAFLIRRLPHSLALGGGKAVGALAYFLAPKRRHTAYVNLKSAFPASSPRERKRWTLEMFQSLGMNGVEILRLPVLGREFFEKSVSTEGYEEYLRRRSSGKGLMLLSSHFGNWELSQIMEAARGRAMMVLTRKQKFEKLDSLLNSFRQYYGSMMVPKGAGIRDLIRHLQDGGCAGVLGDQSGGDSGVWIRFFGRLTTAPKGPLAMALKWNFSVLSAFFIREGDTCHRLVFEPLELVRTGDLERDIEINMQNYIHRLEKYLRKYPGQWLWGHKRWKRTRTKRVLVLSDGKQGHVKQSETVVKEILSIGGRRQFPCEFEVEKIEVKFRSPWHQKLLYAVTPFLLPWIQGRLEILRLFLNDETCEKVIKACPDWIISTGSSLVPLNLLMERENLGKSVVLMNPSFPYNLFQYDIAFVPSHDRGLLPRGNFRVQGAMSGFDPDILQSSGKKLKNSLKDSSQVKMSVFIGGETRWFKPTVQDIKLLLQELDIAAERLTGDYLMTTSRRTSESIQEFLKIEIGKHPRCQLCVIASEDTRPEVVPGMIDLAEYLMVSEDSLSMISETLSSGKKVVVVKFSSRGLPRKHYRFQKELNEAWGIPVFPVSRISEALREGRPGDFIRRYCAERERIRAKLETLF